MKNKRIILVPHTHWDREWYFSLATSNLLLANNMALKNPKPPYGFWFDGQSGALDDMDRFGSIPKVLKEDMKNGRFVPGRLYMQSDFLSSLFATTQLNLDIGTKVAKGFSKEKSKIVYVPDTFGFPEQMPQIWQKNGFDRFVCWRGIKAEDRNKSNDFLLKGIDGSSIHSSLMSEGYTANYAPWWSKKFTDQEKETFAKGLGEYLQKITSYSEQDIYWVPLGRDQVRFRDDIDELTAYAKQRLPQYDFEFGTLEDYFKIHKSHPEIPVIDYQLFYSGTSKIHRTVGSNRYDIKRLFRDTELKLFYKLQPLEAVYSLMGGTPINEKWTEENIYKPLLNSSGHDSLCGCNSDETNRQVVARIEYANAAVESYIDLIKRSLHENLGLSTDQFVIFNAAPFNQGGIVKAIVSNASPEPLDVTNSDAVELIETKVVDRTFHGVHESVYDHHVVLGIRELKAWDKKVFDLSARQPIEPSSVTDALRTNDGSINITIDGKSFSFQVVVEDDLGDSYDFSTNQQAVTTFLKSAAVRRSVKKNNLEHVEFFVEGTHRGIHCRFDGELTIFGKNARMRLVTDNKLKDARVSLSFGRTEVTLSRHLAFIDQKRDKIENWKELGYYDYPTNSWNNDGLVRLESGLNVLTAGNNEVDINNDTRLVLARFTGYIGKAELDYRPGIASGLTYKLETPEGQLNKALEFELGFGWDNSVKALNEWYFGLHFAQGNPPNKTVNRVDRFAAAVPVLDFKKDVSLPVIDHSKVLVGSFQLVKDRVEFVTANPTAKRTDGHKPYEIKYRRNKLSAS